MLTISVFEFRKPKIFRRERKIDANYFGFPKCGKFSFPKFGNRNSFPIIRKLTETSGFLIYEYVITVSAED